MKIVVEKYRERGGLTVEASLVLPIFIICVIVFIYVMKSYYIYNEVNLSMYSVARELSAKLCKTDSIEPSDIKEMLIDNMNKEVIYNSCIKDGVAGINVNESFYDNQKDILYINSKCTISMPWTLININNYKIGNSIVVRCFSGDRSLATNKVFVYVTKTGKVYHTDIACTYLSVKKISVKNNEIENYRNEGGGRYYECKECDDESKGENVYITKYGTSYHNLKTCSSITRTIMAIDIGKLDGRKKCEKCCR